MPTTTTPTGAIDELSAEGETDVGPEMIAPDISSAMASDPESLYQSVWSAERAALLQQQAISCGYSRSDSYI